MRSPSLHPTSLAQRSPSGHPACTSAALKLYNSTSPQLCEICELNCAEFRCRICGRYVCRKHIDLRTHICEVCKMALCSICRESLAVRTCIRCGRIICYECSVQIDEVRNMCMYCFIKYGRKLK